MECYLLHVISSDQNVAPEIGFYLVKRYSNSGALHSVNWRLISKLLFDEKFVNKFNPF